MTTSVIAEPVVHYVRDSSGGPSFPRVCRNAIPAGGLNNDGSLSMAVIDPEGIRHKRDVTASWTIHEPGNGELPGNTWHHIADCPHLKPADDSAAPRE